MLPTLKYTVALLNCVLVLAQATQPNLPFSELNALWDLYNSTGGLNWSYGGLSDPVYWNFTELNPNPCLEGWSGITCTQVAENSNFVHVFDLTMKNYNMIGTLPISIGNLTQLDYFNVQFSGIYGSIPLTVTNMTALRVLQMSSSLLTHIPIEITLCTSLRYLFVAYCMLEGTIPSDLLNNQLYKVDLSNNFLSGPLPSTVNDLIYELDLSDNFFTGTLPLPYGSAGLIFENVFLARNLLSGTIPSQWCESSSLVNINLNSNSFHGSLSDCIATMNQLSSLQINNNHITGTIPQSMFSLSQLITFYAANNVLTGPLPDINMYTMSSMQQFNVSLNQLSGTLSSSFAKLKQLNIFDIGNNMFHGVLFPVCRFPSLSTYFVNGNHFSGSLDSTFVNASHSTIVNIDISNNEFVGTIPGSVFTQPSLQSFAAVSNCFSGTLPSEICSATNLLTIAMDGLRSSQNCQHRFFPDTTDSSYWLSEGLVAGDISACFVGLPHLRVVHLSGNGLDGALVDNNGQAMPANLSDLSLSHNDFHSTIPNYIQYHYWAKLDLSHNKLGGTLRSAFSVYDSSQISLQVNRLSGEVPASFKTVQTISVLNGNLFSCDVADANLPTNDPKHDEYNCGSNSQNNYIYAWIFCVVFLLLCVCVSGMWDPQIFRIITTSLSREFRGSYVGMTQFIIWLFQIRKFFVLLVVPIFVVSMTVNTTLSTYFSVYAFEYAWSISSVNLAGVTPSVVLTVMVLLFGAYSVFLYCHVFQVYIFTSSPNQAMAKTIVLNNMAVNSKVSVKPAKPAVWNSNYFRKCAVIFINIVVTIVVNVGFVVINITQDKTIISLAVIANTLFKMCWNILIVSVVLELSKEVPSENKNKSSGILTSVELAVFVVLFNTLASPFITISFLSSNCFCDVVQTPDHITTTYDYVGCSLYSSIGTCLSYEFGAAPRTTTFIPPFIYNYQCSSTFVTTYSSTYLLQLIVTAFGMPLLQRVMTRIYSFRLWRSNFKWVLDLIVPSILKPPVAYATIPSEDGGVNRVSVYYVMKQITMLKGISTIRRLKWTFYLNVAVSTTTLPQPVLPSVESPDAVLSDTTFCKSDDLINVGALAVNFINLFAILITFGVVFPPIAIMVPVAVFSVSRLTQLYIEAYEDDLEQLRKEVIVAFPIESERIVHLKSAAMSSLIGSMKTKMDNLNSDITNAKQLSLNAFWVAVPFVVLFYAYFLFDIIADEIGWRKGIYLPMSIIVFVVIIAIGIKVLPLLLMTVVNDGQQQKVSTSTSTSRDCDDGRRHQQRGRLFSAEMQLPSISSTDNPIISNSISNGGGGDDGV